MDHDTEREVLEVIAQHYKVCHNCGRPIFSEQMAIINQHADTYHVRYECYKCHHAMQIIFVAVTEDMSFADQQENIRAARMMARDIQHHLDHLQHHPGHQHQPASPTVHRPIEASDVADMVLLLNQHDGDILSLLSKPN